MTRYKISSLPVLPGLSIAIFWDPEWREYQVDVLTFSRPNLNARYHTTDKADAEATALRIADEMRAHEAALGYRSL